MALAKTDAGNTYIAKTSNYQTADAMVNEAVRVAGVNADSAYLAKSGTYTTVNAILEEAQSKADAAAATAKNASIAKTQTYQTAAAIVNAAVAQAATDASGSYIAKTTTYQTADAIVLAAESVGSSAGASSGATAGASAGSTAGASAGQTAGASAGTAAAQTYVDQNAYKKVSGIAITSSGIDISGSKYINISSGGSFTVDSGNFNIDANGNVRMNGYIDADSGYIGNFAITENYFGSVADGVYLRKDVDGGDYTLPGGIFISNMNTGTWVFQANRGGQVMVNGYNLSDGWIKNASVSGNTLTLTKYDGTTVNFTKPAGTIGSLLIESVSGYTNRFAANQYNSGDTSVINAATCEMYLDETTYSRNTWACVRKVGGSRAAYLNLSSYWDAAQSDFFEVTQTTLKPEHISIRYTDKRVTVFYNDQTFKVYYENA